jgi:hypothetical protein
MNKYFLPVARQTFNKYKLNKLKQYKFDKRIMKYGVIPLRGKVVRSFC